VSANLHQLYRVDRSTSGISRFWKKVQDYHSCHWQATSWTS